MDEETEESRLRRLCGAWFRERFGLFVRRFGPENAAAWMGREWLSVREADRRWLAQLRKRGRQWRTLPDPRHHSRVSAAGRAGLAICRAIQVIRSTDPVM